MSLKVEAPDGTLALSEASLSFGLWILSVFSVVSKLPYLMEQGEDPTMDLICSPQVYLGGGIKKRFVSNTS